MLAVSSITNQRGDRCRSPHARCCLVGEEVPSAVRLRRFVRGRSPDGATDALGLRKRAMEGWASSPVTVPYPAVSVFKNCHRERSEGPAFVYRPVPSVSSVPYGDGFS